MAVSSKGISTQAGLDEVPSACDPSCLPHSKGQEETVEAELVWDS